MDEEYFKKQFDWELYINESIDLKPNGIVNYISAWNHLNNHGYKEKRVPFKDPKVFEEFKLFKAQDKENLDIKILEMKNINILINASSNLDITAGDTVMISNYMNLLMKNNNKITLLSRYPVSQTFTRNLESNNYTIIIKQNNREIVEELDIQANNNNIIFIRNHEILENLISKPYLSKTILYGLDVHVGSIKKMNNKFLSIITQSDKLKQLYIENNIPENKIHIVQPFSYKYDFDIEERNDEEIRLIYCGTLRDEENILEIIEEFKKIHLERAEVILKIVYGKIHGDSVFTEKVNKYIKEGVKGITFKHNLTHRDACYEIATSDIGICWRKNGWGDNGEVSTKVKEYEMYGLQIIQSIFNNFFSLDNVYFLYGSKFFNPHKSLSYVTNNINIKNIISFKCKKIEDVIDINIKAIINKPDSEILDNYNGTFKLQITKVLNKYVDKLHKRINNKYQYGHINSFINIINNAKERNLSELVIFEDDVLFHNNIKKLLLNFNNIKKNADIIYFGASKHKDYFVNNSQYKCKNITGTFAIYLKNNVFDDYLELLNLNLLPSDICLLILQEKYKTYVYEPNVIISDLDNSSITPRSDINKLYKQFNWNIDNYISNDPYFVLIVLPTFNRSENIENIINMINKQTYKYYHLLIIDDGSNNHHKETLNNIKHKYKENLNLIFKENKKNLNIANTLNQGIQFLKDDKTNKYSFFTWISDDNIYHDNFLEKLINDNNYFKYSSFNLVNKINNTTKKINIKYNIENLINDFKGCASFMWTKEAILKIGLYNTTINGCEDWEYLIRTFKTGRVKDEYEDDTLIDYIRHPDSLYIKENENIIKLKKNILKIWNFLNNDKANIVYYSKTNYKILFQRPQQIMRFFDKIFNKVFIGNIENVEIDEKYGVLIVPYHLKDCVFNFINNNDKYLYFTDSRLYNEITDKSEYKKIYDLIDAPINEFSVWKPNLEKCVKNSDYVIYSHPDLVNFLNDIDNNREYTYISNACDYEHFSQAKNKIGQRPIDFPQTDKPLLGYYGAFSEWLDYGIIRKHADENKYHIIMIGGIQGNTKYNMRFEHANITWLDHKSYHELPYYLSWFDKCFLPFKDCELTKYVNPCKLWEYMTSEKEIIKYNINMKVDKLIRYEDVCNQINDILCDNDKIINNFKITDEFNYKYNLKYLLEINNKLINNKTMTSNNCKPSVIVFSMIDYYFRIQRNQHISRILSDRGYQVFYLKTTFTSNENKVTEISPNLYEVSLRNNTNDQINVYKTQLKQNHIDCLLESIVLLKEKYNFNHFISYIINPFWYQLVKHINNTSVIFDCLDYTKGFNTHSDIIIKEEELLLENEYTIFTSPILKDLLLYKKNNFTYIRNACDFTYFNSMKKTTNNQRKIIGYYGTISDWFDADLMYLVIKAFDFCDFHFIGNVWCQDKNHENKIKKLNEFNNVSFFGEIPYNELYKYVSKFDIGIIPFIINDLIKCTNPVKLYEMLSLGLPIVLVNLPDVITLQKDNLYYLSNNCEDFISNINKIIKNDNNIENNDLITERINYAENNNWEKCTNLVENVINKVKPHVSIVLLCWNHWDQTKRCIESVLNNSNYPYFELIVVNNNSTDNTKDGLKYYENNYDFIKVVNNKQNYGFARGMNIGALYSKYEYIILLNNDTVVSENWLYPLVKPLILDNYNIGSPITNNCGNEVKQFITYNNVDDLLQKAKKYQYNNSYNVCEIYRTPFFCPILKKHDYFAVGMLDEKYGLGGWEDDDIIEKIKKYNPQNRLYYTYGSFVYHMESLTMSDTNTKGKEWTKQNNNQEIFEKKWERKWIPPEYKFHTLKINIKTQNDIILPLLKNNKFKNQILYVEDDKGIILSDLDNNNEISIINNSENNNEIILKYRNNKFILCKDVWNVFNLYSIINTCINCL